MAVDLTASLQGKLSDPILMEWALQHYSNAKVRDEDYAAELCLCWFDPDTLRHWLASDDQSLSRRLLAYLPVSAFEPLKQELCGWWRDWSGSLAGISAPVLAKLDPNTAAQLFSARGGDADIDAETIIGIINALPDLKKRYALILLKVIAGGNLDTDFQDSFSIQAILERLQPAAMQLDPMIGMRIVDARLSNTEDAVHVLDGIALGSPEYAACAELVRDRRGGDSKQRFADLAPLFQPSAPLAELDRLCEEAGTPLDVLPLVVEWASADQRASIERLLDLIPEDRAQQSRESVIATLLGVVASAAGLKQLDTVGMSLADTLALLAADLRRVPHRDALVERLCEFPREQITPALLETFSGVRQQYGGIGLAAVMGTLGCEQFAAPLIAAMSADGGDFLCEQAELSLVKIGEPALAELIRGWDGLDFSQRIYGYGVLECVGGDTASEFAVARFDALFEDDPENWCGLAKHAPDPRLLPLLEPQLQRHQRYIDECYFIIATLLGTDDHNIEQLSEQLNAHRIEQQHRQDALQRGEWFTPSLDLELECPECGQTNQYRVTQVAYSPQADQQHFLLGMELACVSCQAHTDLSITEQAKVPLAAQLLASRAEPLARSGLLRERQLPHLGRQRSVGEILEYCQSALSTTPQDPAALIRQAVCYRDGLSRPRYARQFFERALAAQPLAAEASLALATELANTGADAEALQLLDEALANKDRWSLFVTDIIKPVDHARHFAKLYNHLTDEGKAGGRGALAEDFLGVGKKVGRNDPCPCGSGRKYKKCCLSRG